MVVVDNFGKLSRLVSCRGRLTHCTASSAMVFDHWVWFFGVPWYVVHERDVHFTAAFWKALLSILGT